MPGPVRAGAADLIVISARILQMALILRKYPQFWYIPLPARKAGNRGFQDHSERFFLPTLQYQYTHRPAPAGLCTLSEVCGID